ncbi:hypothetical protein PRIPAC_77257 [Pristionchus pacificus]|nr:hypothetical protein PRIPAC_77257 [Pristionchus pacificus]
MDQTEKKSAKTQEMTRTIIINDYHDKTEIACNSSSEHSEVEDDYKIDKLFYRISYFCIMLGVNFYRNRSFERRCLSMIILIVNCIINVYFVGYVLYLTLNKPFQAERVAVSISRGTWVVQATLSTLFLAWWQYTSQPCHLLKLLYEANKGAGIHYYRHRLSRILTTFYVVIVLCTLYVVVLSMANFLEVTFGYADQDIPMIFGDRRLFIIFHINFLYSVLCWTVAIFTFSILIHSTHYEFLHYNEQVRAMKCNEECRTDEALCGYLLKLIKATII